MTTKTLIPKNEWARYFATFSHATRGMTVMLEVFDSAYGDVGETGEYKQGPLLAIDYDPAGKGDDIVISTGVTELDHTHTIQSPIEVWESPADIGEAADLEIIDENYVKTVISIRES